jgi:hypothetical protein
MTDFPSSPVKTRSAPTREKSPVNNKWASGMVTVSPSGTITVGSLAVNELSNCPIALFPPSAPIMRMLAGESAL